MCFDKKKMNFVKNSISVNFTVFAQFTGGFLAANYRIWKAFLETSQLVPSYQQNLPETGMRVKIGEILKKLLWFQNN